MPLLRLLLLCLLPLAVLQADPAPAPAAPSATTTTAPAAHVRRVACVGDSITFGMGAGPGRSYPAQLGQLLGPEWEVLNFGDVGRTLLKKGNAPYWRSKKFHPALESSPQVVVIMLGTNDSKEKNFEHRDEFEADYRELIGLFKALPTKPRIFLCRPTPVIAEGKYGINEAGVLALIPLIDKVAAETGCGIIDMHAALADQPKAFPDRVHPNHTGAAAMAEAAFKVISTDPALKLSSNH